MCKVVIYSKWENNYGIVFILPNYAFIKCITLNSVSYEKVEINVSNNTDLFRRYEKIYIIKIVHKFEIQNNYYFISFESIFSYYILSSISYQLKWSLFLDHLISSWYFFYINVRIFFFNNYKLQMQILVKIFFKNYSICFYYEDINNIYKRYLKPLIWNK